MRTIRVRVIPLAVFALVATSCVWPVPLPGDPVPTIETSTSWSATTGTTTLTVTTPDLDASMIRVFPEGLGGAYVEDETAPFTFTFAAADLGIGNHSMPVIATGGGTYVVETETVAVRGCNGYLELCDRSYDDVRQLTAHNAMANAANGWLGPNQNLDVPAQLALGVRGLMLDTYRAGDLNDFGSVQVPGVDPDAAYLCHSFCSLGSQPLVDGLVEIRVFLEANPGAVVTLIIESYLSHNLTADAFIDAGLLPYTYVHLGGAWPTLGEMIDAGDRLVVLQDEAVDGSYPWLMNVWDQSFETHFSASEPADFSCDHNRGAPSNDLFILNNFLTNVFGSPELAAMVNGDPFLVDRAGTCESFHSTAANFVTVDFVDIGDPMAAVNALNGL